MNVIRITVVKRAQHSDLARAIRGADLPACEVFHEGQVFYSGLGPPPGFCAWAWQDLSRIILALHTGGRFDQGVFKGWMNEDNTAVACCTDGFRPVTFKLERVTVRSLIDVSGVDRPAPVEVYETERYGEFSYSFPDLEPGAPYRVRLHLCEVFHTGAGLRRFAVEAGGKRLLDELDLAAQAGGAFKAMVRELDVTADRAGVVELRFVKGSGDLPKVSALELVRPATGQVLQAVNAGGGACGAFVADRFFTGGAVSGG